MLKVVIRQYPISATYVQLMASFALLLFFFFSSSGSTYCFHVGILYNCAALGLVHLHLKNEEYTCISLLFPYANTAGAEH